MRKIRMIEHISLDGVIAPPGDDDYANGGWTAAYRSPEGAATTAEAQGDNFDLLLGRKTYDLWSTGWPKVRVGPFADSMDPREFAFFSSKASPTGLLLNTYRHVGALRKP